MGKRLELSLRIVSALMYSLEATVYVCINVCMYMYVLMCVCVYADCYSFTHIHKCVCVCVCVCVCSFAHHRLLRSRRLVRCM